MAIRMLLMMVVWLVGLRMLLTMAATIGTSGEGVGIRGRRSAARVDDAVDDGDDGRSKWHTWLMISG